MIKQKDILKFMEDVHFSLPLVTYFVGANNYDTVVEGGYRVWVGTFNMHPWVKICTNLEV